MDKLYKYLYGDDVKVNVLVLKDCVISAAQAHNITVSGKINKLASAECFAGILAAEIKDSESSVFVSMKIPSQKLAYNAVAYGDGRICATEAPYTPTAAVTGGMIIETTLHTPSVGDYSSIVCGKQVAGAVKAYVDESMQRKAKYKAFRDGHIYYAVFAEALPGSKNLSAAWKELRTPLFLGVNTEELENYGFKLIQTKDITYGCSCSKRTVKRALLAAGSADIGNGEPVETVCKYCGKKYTFLPEELI